mmetsp:Transcript_16081/g.19635  ORF Transcript_16081/g.19635 Transcript_16081/m.19635 type:complete len:88 (+) Transcript_16081:253-516(+)
MVRSFDGNGDGWSDVVGLAKIDGIADGEGKLFGLGEIDGIADDFIDGISDGRYDGSISNNFVGKETRPSVSRYLPASKVALFGSSCL